MTFPETHLINVPLDFLSSTSKEEEYGSLEREGKMYNSKHFTLARFEILICVQAGSLAQQSFLAVFDQDMLILLCIHYLRSEFVLWDGL